jgi:hypothetical protein
MVMVTSLLMTGIILNLFSTQCTTRTCSQTVSTTFGRTELLNDQNLSFAKTKPALSICWGAGEIANLNLLLLEWAGR